MRPENIAHLLSAEEAFWLNPAERWELVEGRIVEVSPVKKRHGRVLMRLGHRLEEHVQRHNLSEVYAGDVGFILRRNPDTVRAPDLAFIKRERLPAVEEETFSSVMPDLAIEILSPSDRWTEVERKIAEYLQAGVTSVWAVDPSREELRVYRPGQASVTYTKSDTVEDPELLPGLKLGVGTMFSDYVPVETLVRGRARGAFDATVRRRVAARVRVALRALGRGRSSATLVFTDDDEIRVLNREFRKHDRATDVLSFHLQELAGEGDPAGDGIALGDIVISVETARRRAHGRRLGAELERLAVHGLCHLFGHDHKKKAEATVMFALERRLRRLPLTAPV